MIVLGRASSYLISTPVNNNMMRTPLLALEPLTNSWSKVHRDKFIRIKQPKAQPPYLGRDEGEGSLEVPVDLGIPDDLLRDLEVGAPGV